MMNGNTCFVFIAVLLTTGCSAEKESCDNFRPTQGSHLSQLPCAEDSDCSDGPNGRCSFSRFDAIFGSGWKCTYDKCFQDDDCKTDQVCSCGKDTHVVIKGRGDANKCVPANCSTDDDCGGQLCKPTPSICPEDDDRVFGYYCTTENDQCSDNSDCDGSSVCVFGEELGRWGCNYGCP